VNAAQVKKLALELGADLVGIAGAATLNAFPPDPRHPQTPDRIWPECKSVVVIAQHVPVGAFRCKSNVAVQYLDVLVMRKMDKVAYRLAERLERAGFASFVTAAQETDWNLKRGSYGRLSTRHLGVEAGLGTLGLGVCIITPEFGPRLYLTGVLTELELEPDSRITEQVCIGESCSRCLYGCPADSIGHFKNDKAPCSNFAQESGLAAFLRFFDRFIEAPPDKKTRLTRSSDLFGCWQSLVHVVASFGACPRCMAVCPVGDDYHAHLAQAQKEIPEKTPEKVARASSLRERRRRGEPVDGLNDWNARWVGPDGYQQLAARQRRAFKKLQTERAARAARDSEQ
jgi:ferredoxin